MFKASYFTYDGVYSQEYGLRIATFDSNPLERTAYISPTIETQKPAGSKKFYYQNIKYDNAPTMQFSVVRDRPITEDLQREITSWLEGRRGYKKLVIHQNDLSGFYYKCIFTVDEILYFAGECVGFVLTASFDSPYMYGKATTLSLTGTGTVSTQTIVNKSNTRDEYVFPTVTFKATSYVDTDKNVSIINTTDSSTREFWFKSAGVNNEISVDNETKIISAQSGTDLLTKFNRNWLRLKPGKNTLSIKITGTIMISCPHYEKIRF